MQKWEYLIVDTNNTAQTTFYVMSLSSDREIIAGDQTLSKMVNQDITVVMPQLGLAGWELVCCHPSKAFSISGQRLFFKRVKILIFRLGHYQCQDFV